MGQHKIQEVVHLIHSFSNPSFGGEFSICVGILNRVNFILKNDQVSNLSFCQLFPSKLFESVMHIT